MQTVEVYSKIAHDKGHIADSPIWNEANHRDELQDFIGIFKYTIKFDGLKPIQLTKTKFNPK